MSFESRCVRYFSNMLWETAPCRRSCVGKASISEFDACPWSLIFAGTSGAQTSTGLQICCSGDFISKVGWCSFRVYSVPLVITSLSIICSMPAEQTTSSLYRHFERTQVHTLLLMSQIVYATRLKSRLSDVVI